MCFVYYRPDDNNDAIKYVVRVSQVLKEAKSGQLQDHLQCEHASEDDVADLKDIGQLVRLGGGETRVVRDVTKQEREKSDFNILECSSVCRLTGARFGNED